jgi:hypothetical protein
MRLAQRVRPRQRGLDAAPQVGRDAAREEARIDSEAGREPLHGLTRGSGLPPLDLADVLLGEALARELALREAGTDP